MTHRGRRTGPLLNCFTTFRKPLRYPNLATEFVNGVVVDVESQHAGLVISEVMWGEDVSLNPSSNSQYIELYNPGGQYKTVADADHTPDINEAVTLIFYRANEFGDIPAATPVVATATAAATTALPAGVTDRIGTLDATGAYWNPAGKGQSGASGTPIERGRTQEALKSYLLLQRRCCPLFRCIV